MKKWIIMIILCLLTAISSSSAAAESLSNSGLGNIEYISPPLDDLFNMQVGESTKLTILAHNEQGDFDVTALTSLTIKDPVIIKLEKSGIETSIIALKEGATEIHAEFEGFTADIPVTVFASGTIDVHNVYKNINFEKLTNDRQESLSIINRIRGSMGMEPFVLNEQLNKAAQAHSNYLKFNGSGSAHLEFRGNPGFTGEDPGKRVQFYGYDAFAPVGEVISWDGDAAEDTLSLIDAPLHRTILLSPDFNEAGIGVNDTYNTVINPGAHDSSVNGTAIVYYPYNNQTNVPASWFAAESPNPLAPFGQEYQTVGYPISISPSRWNELMLDHAVITDSAGQEVSFYTLDNSVDPMASGSIYLIPKNPLKPGTKYTVKASYKVLSNETGTSANKSLEWDFTTEAYQDKVKDLYTEEFRMSAELGKPAKLGSFKAIYDSGKEEDVTDEVTFRYDPEVMEVKNGYVTVKKANIDEYLFLEAVYKKVSTLISIHVWEPLEQVFLNVNPFSSKDRILTGKSLPNSDVYVQYNGKIIAQGKTDENGNFALPVTSFESGTELIVVMENTKGQYALEGIIVEDKARPQAPEVYPVNENDESIKGKAEPNSFIYIKKGDSLLAEGVSTGMDGSFSAKITPQKAGSKLTVYAVDDTNNKGEETFIIVNAENKGSSKFTDVSPRYQGAVDYLYQNEITKGMSPTLFGVQEKIKRADAALLIFKALKLSPSNADAGFKDVPERARRAVNALVEHNIINGKSNGYFGSGDYLTRGEAALILTKAYQLDGSGVNSNFSDVGSRYQYGVNALVKNNITQGMTDQSFGTQETITRGQMAIFLYKADK